MADDVTVINNSGNTGTDYVVATDEVQVSGTNPIGQVQFVKLVDGTLNGTTPIAGGANGLRVDPSNVTSPVSAASWPLPTGAATETTIAAILAKFPGAALVQGHGTAAAALRVELPTDGTGVVGLNAGTQVIGSLTANQSVNTAQIAGTATAVNSGTLSAGVQRVTLATDQVQLTNALKVDGSAVTQPVSGTVTTTPPSNATTNVTQFGGNNVVTGPGAGGSGIPRVTVSTDTILTGNQGAAATVPNSWPMKVTDGSANTAAVKAASTAAVAADPALVVALSPNSPSPALSAGTATIGGVLLQGTDGVTSALTAFVQALDGKNTLFTENPQERRLLEQILLELQAQNQVSGISPGSFMLPPSKPDPLINGNAISIASATTVQTLAPINVTRSGLSIYNNSTSILYVLASRTGTVASTLFTALLNPNDYWEAPQGPGGCYKGIVTGVWVSANGSAMVTEYTS